jgi:hypothetical protein
MPDQNLSFPMDSATVLAIKHSRASAVAATSSPLDLYLQTPAFASGSPLGYWRQQQHHQQGLSQMAKDILPGPTSKVSVERTFSVPRQVCPYQRILLHGSIFQQTLVVQQHNRLMTIYTANDDEEEGEVREVEKESMLLDTNDFQQGRSLAICNEEDDQEEEHLQLHPILKKGH